MGAWRRLWASVGFRLAFQYAVLVAITMMAALAIVYLQTVGVLHQRIARQVGVTTTQMQARAEQQGLEAVAAAIGRALDDGRQSDTELFGLWQPDGTRLAGNLDAPPADATGGRDGQQRAQRGGTAITGYLAVRRLPGDALLVVGHDLSDQDALESLVVSASAAAGLIALLLLVGGVFVFRQELEQAVGRVRRTAGRIAEEGHLAERVDMTTGDDEFARLGQDINAMLDRIESLMEGVRHVSNTIAHELRTPLTRALLGLQAAQAPGVDDAARREAIDRAVHELQDLGTVFQKLLQIAEAEAGARRRAFAPVALHTIADDVLELYEAVAENQGAHLVREPADEARVDGDRDLLAGAIANLVDNALKYGGPGCTVRIGTTMAADQAIVEVQDDGPGVSEADLARLGERFTRLTPELPGHGLGLANVRAVAALHRGRLVAEGAEPGLRMRMVLPIGSPSHN
ncbi:HAMP domain-containing sensor histidine kinase [uncultured Pseudacidovorax sp.]|uniref:sensor histidine kinase n=1 Tax=uncultured Pseudacidovorax sp. TaxID=679313 RepID=UPI0025DCDA87|nr:HAMP domain-containing sensor histidine kinase [uncultured Pseudacidovorax sp.]